MPAKVTKGRMGAAEQVQCMVVGMKAGGNFIARWQAGSRYQQQKLQDEHVLPDDNSNGFLCATYENTSLLTDFYLAFLRRNHYF